MPRKGKTRRKEEVIEMFDIIWDTFLKIVEEDVFYDVHAPLTTRKVLEKLEDMLRLDLADSLYEVLANYSDFHVALATSYFAGYVVGGELPSREELEAYIGIYMEACYDRETLDEFVACVNTYYDYFLRLVKFFDALPKLLEVKIVEGDVAPDLYSSEFPLVSNTWTLV
jgi:hypothetical protein